MDYIKFLGTAGARFAVMRQIRKSGGIWLSLDDTNVLIDPGPGSLIGCLSSEPKLSPLDLDGIILSHKHIDHSNDVNIIIEAMTNGGHSPKGVLFAPSDALYNDPVVLHHFRNHIKDIQLLQEKKNFNIGNLSFSTPIKHIHDVETFGLRFDGSDVSVSYITDSKYFDGLESYYDADVVIINVVLMDSIDYINHLSVADVEHIIRLIKPKMSIITHFGMSVLEHQPERIAEMLSKKLNTKVVAASDGMTVSLDKKTLF